jgi:3alpha(or 20beta)-hydroxysteroid dehydrogenase
VSHVGRVDGKTILVTGGARGIGAAYAESLAWEGAQVVIGDVNPDVAETARRLGRGIVAQQLDVASEESWNDMVSFTEQRFGPIHVLVNNAAILITGSLFDLDLDDYRRTIDVNQTGVFLGMRAVVPSMRRTGRACSIINVSSVAGLSGLAARFSYVTSKWAVRGMTKAAAMELAPFDIRVNSVHPGFIATDMSAGLEGNFAYRIPVGRLGSVDDLTPIIVYLASDESRYASGAEFVIDGGATAGLHRMDK